MEKRTRKGNWEKEKEKTERRKKEKKKRKIGEQGKKERWTGVTAFLF